MPTSLLKETLLSDLSDRSESLRERLETVKCLLSSCWGVESLESGGVGPEAMGILCGWEDRSQGGLYTKTGIFSDFVICKYVTTLQPGAWRVNVRVRVLGTNTTRGSAAAEEACSKVTCG